MHVTQPGLVPAWKDQCSLVISHFSQRCTSCSVATVNFFSVGSKDINDHMSFSLDHYDVMVTEGTLYNADLSTSNYKTCPCTHCFAFCVMCSVYFQLDGGNEEMQHLKIIISKASHFFASIHTLDVEGKAA